MSYSNTIIKALYIVFINISLIKSKSRSGHDKKCIKKNEWDFTKGTFKEITDPKECTSIYPQCCHISINYKYINHEVSASYCASLYIKKGEAEEKLRNLIRDDLIYYSNYTYHNYDKYLQLGMNYENQEEIFKNYNCVTPLSEREFSNYMYNHCAKFGPHKGCLFEKDDQYFKEFASNFHSVFSEEYCSKKDKGKCIVYNQERKNDQMIRPLFQDLLAHLAPQKTDGYDEDDEEDGGDMEANVEDTEIPIFWNKKCVPLPEVNIKITYPDGYSIAYYYELCYKIIIFIILCII